MEPTTSISPQRRQTAPSRDRFNVVGNAQELPQGGFLHHRRNGRMLPPFIAPTSVQELSNTWDTSEEDVFICTHQKVGTHLTKKFIVEILRATENYGSDHPMSAGDIGHGAVPWPEVMHSQRGARHFRKFLQRTSGTKRLWYTHAAYEDLPIRRVHPKSKFVVVLRDPRATAVSQYFFYKRHPLLQISKDLDMDTFSSMFIEGDLYFGDYHQHTLGWIRRRDNRIPNSSVLVLRYEDLVENKLAVIDRLLTFLAPGKRLTDKRKESIAASTTFQSMKKSLTKDPKSFHLDPKAFFRSGQTKDWEQHLSNNVIKAINRKTNRTWGRGDLTCPPLDGLMSL